MMEEDVNTQFNFSIYLLNNTTVEISTVLSDSDLLLQQLGERRQGITTVVILTLVYSTIFITGLIGNFCTCIVIWKNTYMHTVTNYYLFNLAISDVLTLVLALPPEVYSIWKSYPWQFGEPFCILKSFIMEMTSYASVLTITGFTIERYLAICHSIRAQHCCQFKRATKCIVIIWAISTLSALPYPIHTRTFYYLTDSNTSKIIPDSLVCNIPLKWTHRMLAVFQLSTFIYFVVPMMIIALFYILIGCKLRQSEFTSNGNAASGKATAARARRAIIKMLVAVVVAFFLCFAPFHAQRLMTLYVKHWTAELHQVQSYLFFVSGILYFFSSTVNPILYNLLSRKFRRAFKRTLCRCCSSVNSLPTFYMLKAKFINDDVHDQSYESQSQGNQSHNKSAFRLVTYYRNEKNTSKIRHPLAKQWTKDTLLNKTSHSSSCSSHAHSDGGLHAICRHKRCTSRRQSALSPRQQGLVASFQDIDALRRHDPPNSPSRRNGIHGDTSDVIDRDETSVIGPLVRVKFNL